ncbi:hypothetical protein LQE92_08910 [Lacrimispora sp. NSJ-141]|uniref:Uncharacterized protein n=1 Tax=Lientehia hominis TaxID=2897778 RepID=A0AAP2WA40_9FIRM|nr:hypothetical protein [Lientehia hominis]MCD2492747.1 hypothetical protein [Lientehia hominis]
MDWERILNDSFFNLLNNLKTIFLSPKMTPIYVGIVLSFVAGIIIKTIRRFSFKYYLITGDSKRKARRKSELLADSLSLLEDVKEKK